MEDNTLQAIRELYVNIQFVRGKRKLLGVIKHHLKKFVLEKSKQLPEWVMEGWKTRFPGGAAPGAQGVKGVSVLPHFAIFAPKRLGSWRN